MVVGCVCDTVALLAMVVIVVWFKISSKPKNESVEVKSIPSGNRRISYEKQPIMCATVDSNEYDSI